MWDPKAGAGPQERAECDCPRPDICRQLGCIAKQEDIDREVLWTKLRRLLFLSTMAILALGVLWQAYQIGQRTSACHDAGGFNYRGLCLERPEEIKL